PTSRGLAPGLRGRHACHRQARRRRRTVHRGVPTATDAPTTADDAVPGEPPRGPNRPSHRRAYLIGAVAIVAVALVAITAGLVLADDDDPQTSTATEAVTAAPSSTAASTTSAPTPVAPPP